ncbi:IS3 family transposase [Bacillus atrophaeus]
MSKRDKNLYNHERLQKKLNQCAPIEYRNTLIL